MILLSGSYSTSIFRLDDICGAVCDMDVPYMRNTKGNGKLGANAMKRVAAGRLSADLLMDKTIDHQGRELSRKN